MTQYAPVVVIGAGPYGLSLSAHLRARNCSPVVFGRPMDSWRFGTPPSMRLKSEGFASSISDPRGEFTLKTFCQGEGFAYADINLPTPIQTFVAYGDAFQKRFVPQLDTRVAREIREAPGGFEIELEDGARLAASQCVVATGLTRFERVPAPLSNLTRARFAHTAQICDYGVYAGKRVLVVGAGASATNAAGELLRHGVDVTLTCRDSELRFYDGGETRTWRDAIVSPLSPIGPGWRKWAVSRFPEAFRALPEHLRVRIVNGTLGAAPAWFVRQEIEGKIGVLAGQRIVAARETANGAAVEMTGRDGVCSTYEFDHVIAGTGYQVDVDRLDFLSLDLRAGLKRVGGAPKLSRAFESSVPGLYFVGPSAAYHFGPALRFVCGAEFASKCVSAAIVRSARGRSPRGRNAPAALAAMDLSAPTGG